jgi:hypothetical protein
MMMGQGGDKGAEVGGGAGSEESAEGMETRNWGGWIAMKREELRHTFISVACSRRYYFESAESSNATILLKVV